MRRKESNTDKELERLLDTLRPVPARNPEAAARSKTLFLEQAKRMRPTVSQISENRRKKQSGLASPLFHKKERSPLLNTLFAIFMAIVFFFGGTGITVYAAQESMPDEMLYPLKTLSEDVFLSLTTSTQKQIDLNLDYTDRRVAEITGLYAWGKSVPQGVVDRLYTELNKMLEEATHLDDQAMIQTLERVRARAEVQLETMSVLMANGPADPSFIRALARIQEQVDLAAMGEVDPQGFRVQVGQQFQFMNGTSTQTPGSGNGQPGAGSIAPEGTPFPVGNGNETGQGQSESGSQSSSTPEGTPAPGGNGGESGQGGSQPTNNQGQQGPAATQTPSPSRTPHSGGGSGKGP